MDYSFQQLKYLYIHWPFCPYKCNFCDFVALASHEEFMNQYHKSLCNEIKSFHGSFGEKTLLKTIYMGGGTPSTYPLDQLLDMFATLEDIFIFDQTTEVTLEVNPGTLKERSLDVWKQVGINRLSVGVQSLKDVVLKGLNRHQKRKDVIELLDKAQGKFENISVDFILGLPGVSAEEWKSMIQEAMSWPIKHISVYFLMVHEKTPLYFKVKKKSVVLPPDDEIIDLYHWTVDILKEHGFERYELSNFAKPGFQSRHNQAYWERESYKGFGLGACSFNGKNRFQNSKNLQNYFDAVEKNEGLIIQSESLSEKQIATEKIMLGLRQIKGVDIEDVTQNFSTKQKERFLSQSDYLEKQGLLKQMNGKLFLTPRGFVVENEVAVNLFPE